MTSFSNPTQVAQTIRVRFAMDRSRAKAAELRELAKIICAANEPSRDPMDDMLNLDGMTGFRQVKLWEYYKETARAVLKAGWRR
jgi:hypothetical protein